MRIFPRILTLAFKERNSQKRKTNTSYRNDIEYSSLQPSERIRRNFLNNPELSSSSSDEDIVDALEDYRRSNKIKRFSMVSKGTYNMRQEFENSYEELVDSEKKIRKIRIIIIILIALVVAGLIAVAVIYVLRKSDDSPTVASLRKNLELNEVIYGNMHAKPFNGTWISGKDIVYLEIESNTLWEYDVTTKMRRVLFKSPNEKFTHYSSFEKSPDKRYLLGTRAPIRIFRHSFTAFYDIIDLETRKVDTINISGTPVRLLFAKWAPVGNALILNFERNLYYKESAQKQEIQLTNDGNELIVNGHPDWVYEEEVLYSNIAVWFNPSGTKIAFIKFDDTSTRLIGIPVYGHPGDLNFQYPLLRQIPYPKSGSSNPFVKLHQIDLKTAITSGGIDNGNFEIQPPTELNTDDHIITAVKWLTDNSVMSVWMNRIQNQVYIQVTDDTKRYNILNYKSPDGWVDLFTAPLKDGNGSNIAFLFPQNQGEAGDYKHLVVLPTSNYSPHKPIPLTSGKFVVQEILHWDDDENLIFYSANEPGRSEILHIYAVKAERAQKPHCITCNLVVDRIENISQTYYGAEFSLSGKYIAITSRGPNVPYTAIYEWSFQKDNLQMKLLLEWETNKELRDNLTKRSLPTTEFLTIDVENGFTAKVLLYLPPNIDKSGAKKYPLLIDVYGGPDSNAVTERWSINYGSYLASNKSIIYGKIDGRGSGLRGDKLLHSIYLKLGTYEVYDQINVTRTLQNTLPYIDATRTGIWGWSYGGFATGMALALDDRNFFKCGVSVAPVTDWLYYDSIYTERYMSLPNLNQLGYKKSRLTDLASKFHKKKYLLVHGTLDDNVHYQQSMIFAKQLEENGVFFKQITYPDEDHSLGNVRPHLYHSLDHFFENCFNLTPTEEDIFKK